MPAIKNYMEDCVSDVLPAILDEINACKCEACQYDITAIALNSLPPKYVVSHKGELYTKLSKLQQQFDVDIVAAITKAAVIVGRYPRHGAADRIG
ncbi:MAG: late competence development ComFB family protein [Clostridiales bacterium]|jgi:competence protein ComFB|nr:late competence development ComFB family protein [Clostridiales bacterium]